MNTSHNPALDDHTTWRAALVFAVVILLFMGLAYSLIGTGIGRLLFADGATGSLVRAGDRVIGSALVAQPFVDARYFSPRPSAPNYDPMATAGSNQARSNPDLRARIDGAIAEVAQREGIQPGAVPIDLVTQSGGGLDPHVSPAAARVQIARVAKARNLTVGAVTALVEQSIEPPQFGVLGKPRVNVLRLNVALDALR